MYAVQQAEIIATLAAGGWFGWIAAAALALWFSRSDCGFGPRGFYYNTWPTHEGADAFAIDFTRYRQYVPYYPQSGGTPVFAARAGIVRTADAGTPSGSPSASNTVEIEHADPDNPTDTKRFTSRYLHLEGPRKVMVSPGMAVPAGKLLGYMDDTGNSVLNHLHFSIHDRTIPYPDRPSGASVRPTPMSGVRLDDQDSGACVCSTNVERGKPVIEAVGFAGQNWLITPAARAVNQPVPPGVQGEKWLLVLSGVATLDVQGNSESQWRHETVSDTSRPRLARQRPAASRTLRR
jgi:murein DD-endopeptidase MepM/ murein hydrolase activator NlpD